MVEYPYSCFVCAEPVDEVEHAAVKFLEGRMSANAQKFYADDLGLVHITDDKFPPRSFDDEGHAVICLKCHHNSQRRYKAVADGLAKHSLIPISGSLIDEVEDAIRVQHPEVGAFAQEWIPEGHDEPVNTLLHGEVYYELEDKLADMLYEHIDGGDPHRCPYCDGTLWRLQEKTVADGGKATVAVCLRCGYEDNV